MMDPTRIIYPWKMLFWLTVVIVALIAIVSACYAQSPTVSTPGRMPNHAPSGQVGGPVMVIPPTGSPTFLYSAPPAPVATPVPQAAPLMIIPPVGMPTFVYPGLAQ